MFKLTKAHYLLLSLQALAAINGFIHLQNKNWLGATIALGLFIIFMPSKANAQFYSGNKDEALQKDNRIHMSLRYFGLFILLISLTLDLLT